MKNWFLRVIMQRMRRSVCTLQATSTASFAASWCTCLLLAAPIFNGAAFAAEHVIDLSSDAPKNAGSSMGDRDNQACGTIDGTAPEAIGERSTDAISAGKAKCHMKASAGGGASSKELGPASSRPTYAQRWRSPHIISYNIYGNVNAPWPSVEITTQRIVAPPAFLVVLPFARYTRVSALTRKLLAVTDCLRTADFDSERYYLGIDERDHDQTVKCAVAVTVGCRYLSEVVELPGISWTPTEIQPVTSFMDTIGCSKPGFAPSFVMPYDYSRVKKLCDALHPGLPIASVPPLVQREGFGTLANHDGMHNGRTGRWELRIPVPTMRDQAYCVIEHNQSAILSVTMEDP